MTSGPIKGLKNAPDGTNWQTDGWQTHRNWLNWLNWSSGADSGNKAITPYSTQILLNPRGINYLIRNKQLKWYILCPVQLIRQYIPYKRVLAVYASQSIKRLLKQFLSLLQIATSTINYCPVIVMLVVLNKIFQFTVTFSS